MGGYRYQCEMQRQIRLSLTCDTYRSVSAPGAPHPARPPSTIKTTPYVVTIQFETEDRAVRQTPTFTRQLMIDQNFQQHRLQQEDVLMNVYAYIIYHINYIQKSTKGHFFVHNFYTACVIYWISFTVYHPYLCQNSFVQ